VLLGSVCLRRTRELLDLPDPIPELRKLRFSHAEREEYNDIQQQCRREIDMAVSGHGKGKLNSTVLESLLKLRLFCNNGISKLETGRASQGNERDVDEALSYLQQSNEADCAYCFEPVYSISEARDTDGGLLIPSCLHLVCRGCMSQYHAEKNRCPRCPAGSIQKFIPFLVQGASQAPDLDKATLLPTRGRYPTKLLAFLGDISLQLSQKR
jgi:SWI/SNF-related matrix-associated actin-dependent regulator of chromatin subfamily A3